MNAKTAKKLRKLALGLATISEEAGIKISERVLEHNGFAGTTLENSKDSLRGLNRKLKKSIHGNRIDI